MVARLGRDGPRNSIVNYTLFPGRSVVVAQTVDSLNGVYLKVPAGSWPIFTGFLEGFPCYYLPPPSSSLG